MNAFRFRRATLSALTAAALLSACGGGGSSTASWSTDGNIKLRFAAVAGSTPITCDTKLKLGTKGRAVQMADFRFYISNVNLIKADGSKVALKLKGNDDHNFSNGTDSVSLIDLEQKGAGLCEGSSTTNAVIEGTVPAGNYTGAEMTLGVPFALNHLSATDAATPRVLQSSVHPGMAWNWRGGRKFTNIEFDQDRTADNTPWESAAAGKDGYVLLHLGSTGCMAQLDGTAPSNPAVSATNPITACKAPNRVPVSFTSFDPAKQTIALDAAALFGYDIASLAEGFNGCMSSPTDRACTKPFETLALDFGKVLLDASNKPVLGADGFAKIDGKGTGLPITGKTQGIFKLVNP